MKSDQARRLIATVVPLDPSFADDRPLRDAGLDSIGAVRLVTTIEDSLHLRVPRQLITAERFATIDSVRDLLSALQELTVADE